MAAKAYRSRNADRARRLRSRFREPQIRIFDCPHCLTALLVIETSRVRHVEAACRALDQPHSDRTLERRNAAADRRLWHAKQARGSRETARLDDTSKHHDIVEIKHLYPEMGRFKGHRVKALTRKPDSNAARQLMSAGADLVTGDLGDAASVLKAASGVATMFLMGNSNEAGTEEETRQGIIAAEAAKAAGVGHLIYSSVADANKKTGIPHFESKYLVEKHVAGLGIPYTISAPASFMENIVAPWSIGALSQGTYAFPMPPKRVLQLVALADIGAFVAALIERRDQVFGKRFDLAGDELSGEEQARILSHAIGRPINYQEIPIAAARQQSEDVALMFEWFDRVGADADIAALRRDFSEVRWHSFADWAREFDWTVLERTSSVA